MKRIGANDILIVYGIARLTDEIAAVADREGEITIQCLAPHLVVRPDSSPPLRLNSAPYEISAPPAAGDAADDWETLRFLHAHFRKFCDLWTKRQHALLDRYMAFVEAEATAHRAELEEKLAPFGTLFSWRDWVYSAPRPMPRAHAISVAALAGAPGLPGASRPADLAFWTGGRLVALRTAGGSAEPPRSVEVETIDVPDDALDSPAADGLGPLLPDAFHRFWRDQVLPAGPFRPALTRPPAA